MTVAASTKLRLNWTMIIALVIFHIGAICAFLPGLFSWQAVGVAVLLHWITGGLGITLGWHRLLSHRSFQVPKWLEYFFAFCGTLALQGGIIWWVGLHRHHHLHSDEDVDHHDSKKGFIWSHVRWMCFDVPAESDIPRFTKDIADDPFYQFLNNYFFPLQVVLGVVLYAIGSWPFVFWGVFARLVIVYHCTWLVNSATHKFGYRNFETTDNSTNCWWVAITTYGEGWHNNHHAYQYSARHGMKWWEIDITWMTIQVLQLLGLATKVKLVEAGTTKE
ncbi:fatty acid desaturase [Chamaesiphon sp. VAR_48_metabat_135_sub]|uniref:acyl-CoA desaturase n=1 Tax=Chamaesiphon sp. VAR_48_metabat_135_sub TaxID=2964699 RepID=UPI00286A2AD2|nr:fatty acid desaturase [Chamaesiphon sp. VAR_48_metabat_135_sub]